MPLAKGKSKKTISKNIREMRKSEAKLLKKKKKK